MGQSWVTEGVCQQKGFACAAKHLMELSDNKEPSLKCPAVKRVGGEFWVLAGPSPGFSRETETVLLIYQGRRSQDKLSIYTGEFFASFMMERARRTLFGESLCPFPTGSQFVYLVSSASAQWGGNKGKELHLGLIAYAEMRGVGRAGDPQLGYG